MGKLVVVDGGEASGWAVQEGRRAKVEAHFRVFQDYRRVQGHVVVGQREGGAKILAILGKAQDATIQVEHTRDDIVETKRLAVLDKLTVVGLFAGTPKAVTLRKEG